MSLSNRVDEVSHFISLVKETYTEATTEIVERIVTAVEAECEAYKQAMKSDLIADFLDANDIKDGDIVTWLFIDDPAHPNMYHRFDASKLTLTDDFELGYDEYEINDACIRKATREGILKTIAFSEEFLALQRRAEKGEDIDTDCDAFFAKIKSPIAEGGGWGANCGDWKKFIDDTRKLLEKVE